MHPEDFLTKQQFQMLLDNAETPVHRAILLLMGGTGMRVQEVASLKAGDVDRAEQYIYVREGKGGKDRTVIVPSNVFDAIEALHIDKGYLFVGRQSGHVSTRQIQRWLDEIALKAGLQETRPGEHRQRKKITPHLLRHSHASWLLDSHVPVSDVQAQLGHASLLTTALYLVRRPNHRRESFQRCGWI